MRTFQDLLDLLEERGEEVTDENAAEQTLSPRGKLFEDLELIIYGEIAGTGKILGFSKRHLKQFVISDIARYRLVHLLKDCGEQADQFVYEGKAETPGKWSMNQVRMEIAKEACSKQVDLSHQMGAGIWDSRDRLILIGKNELAIYDGGLQQSSEPSIDGKIIDFHAHEHWYDFEKLSGYLNDARNPAWVQQAWNDLTGILSRWDNWKYTHDPDVAASLMIATWLQTVWDWRPLVFVTGPAGSGKTMLLHHFLRPFYGTLSLTPDKPSEAGLRHEVKQSAQVVILDEFESDIERTKIIKSARMSGRGGKTVRGTPHGGAVSYGFKHIFWCGAIETGLSDAADRSRFIILDLMPVADRETNGDDEEDSPLKLPSEEDVADLGQKCLAIAMVHWKAIKKRVDELRDASRLMNLDARMADSYSLPCAVMGVAAGFEFGDTYNMMRAILSERLLEDMKPSDERDLLEEIMQADVQIGRGEKKMVMELLDPADTGLDSDRLLGQVGIKKIRAYKSEPDRVAFIPGMVKKKLLRGTKFQFVDIEAILLRAGDAQRRRVRLSASNVPAGVLIPQTTLDDLLGVLELDADLGGDLTPAEAEAVTNGALLEFPDDF